MNKEVLYELRPAEFEQLCAEILKAQGFESVQLVGGPADQGVDIIAQTEGRPVAVQVKHTRQLSRDGLRDIVLRLKASPYQANELLVITSAAATYANRVFLAELSSQGLSVRLLAQDDVLEILAKHPDIEQTMISPARSRSRRQKRELWLGIVVALLSLVAGISVNFVSSGRTQAPLDQRIETVERAIGSLKNLEQDLTDIKDEMVDTERAVQAIKEEHAKAKELEKLPETQYDAVKAALRSRSWQQTVLNYVLGFILGAASSLTASVIYSRWKQRRALAE